MRLLHTSDWHLGRGLHGVDLHVAQQHVLDQIVALVASRGVDAVLICGDVFDRAVPPVSAVQLWDRTLRALCEQVPVVVIPGNHDSAPRLGVGADLFRSGVHVVADVDAVGTPVTLHDDHGAVRIYPVPFLDPDVARHALAGASDTPLPRSHEAAMAAAMARIRSDHARRSQDVPARIVVMAHAFVVAGAAGALPAGDGAGGGEPQRSDSERDIRVGGVDSVPVDVFDGIDYVALGHLHGAQRVEGPQRSGRVRYSGSPLRYSFSEAAQHKQVAMVDLLADGSVEVETVELEQPQGMSAVAGSLERLLTDPGLTEVERCWVQVTVTDPARPPQMVPRVKERFPDALVVRHVPATGPLATSSHVGVPASPLEVAESFVRYVTGGDITTVELDVFRDAYEQVLASGREA